MYCVTSFFVFFRRRDIFGDVDQSCVGVVSDESVRIANLAEQQRDRSVQILRGLESHTKRGVDIH
jgi:hypothetical protein